MPKQIEHFYEHDEKGDLALMQYKCKCGNFEEVKVINGDYSFKKFHIYTAIKDELYPLRYICNKCHVERKRVWDSPTRLNP